MVQMFKMIISPAVFFNFKILIFQVIRGLKGQRMAQNDKNFCLLHLIFQEPDIIYHLPYYIPYIIYGAHVYMCKRIISPGIFFIFFQNLYFRDH